jgi:hypothetical protein
MERHRLLFNEASVAPVSIVFEDSIFPYLGEVDRAIIEMELSAEDLCHFVHNFSPELKRSLLSILGRGSARLLKVDPGSSKRFLRFGHLEEGPITFSVKHISQLPEWTSPGDHIIVEKITGPPYLQGDHHAVDPKGALDFAVPSILRDAVWVNNHLCLVSQPYPWDKQYLGETRAAKVFQNCLASTPRFGMKDDQRTYEETGTKYRASANAPFLALKEISEQHQNRTIAIVGRKNTFLRPGMGVAIDPPLIQCIYVETIYGSVVEIDKDSECITIRLLVGTENLPEYAIGKLGKNEVVQTNALLTVPFDWVYGTFRLFPSLLFQADCIPQASESESAVNKLLSRTVVCDMKFSQDDAKAGKDDIMVTCNIFSELLKGKLSLTFSRMKPFPAQVALGFLHDTHELFGGLHPPAFAYQPHLKDALSTFAFQKAQHARSSKDPHTIRLEMPGNALMELVYLKLKSDEFRVYFKNGVMMLEVRNPATLAKVIGFDPFIYDLKKEGYGEVEFKGPFVLKWSLYVSDEPSGPLWGSASISIGSYTEKCRMGTDVIKSSREHPEALRGSGIAVKKARVSKDSSLAGRTKQATKAPAQAQERQRRQEKRMALKSTSKGGALAAAALTGGGEGAGAAVPLAASAAASSDGCPSPSVLSADKLKSGQRPPACIHLRCIV